jgi:hypothetical protein
LEDRHSEREIRKGRQRKMYSCKIYGLQLLDEQRSHYKLHE